jgi:16S rRNA processing protein RimM
MDHFQLGYFSKAKGLKGELVLQFAVRNEEDYDDMEVLYVEERPGQLVPYFIEYLSRQHKGLVCKLQDFSTVEKVQKFIGKKVFLPEEERMEDQSFESMLESWIGCNVIDQHNKVVGSLQGVETYPHQIIALLDIDGKEALVPVNDNTLTGFDENKDLIIMNIPDGLLDIYLEEGNDDQEDEEF